MELILEVRDAEEGGFTRAREQAISTEAEAWPELALGRAGSCTLPVEDARVRPRLVPTPATCAMN